MRVIKSSLFERFPELIFGFSTKIGLNRKTPFFFNLSFTVGDDETVVKENRSAFFDAIGLMSSKIAYQKQIHSDTITVVERPGPNGESDAMITVQQNIGLAIFVADCTPIFIYDKKNKVVAAVHSGWRGAERQILNITLSKLFDQFNSQPQNLFVYFGPSISQKNYEVGEEVAMLFDHKYIQENSGKLFLDVPRVNADIVFEFGIPNSNVEISPLCTFEENELLHSYRRDGKFSGRSLGVIAMRGK